jgi:hypothetical protein
MSSKPILCQYVHFLSIKRYAHLEPSHMSDYKHLFIYFAALNKDLIGLLYWLASWVNELPAIVAGVLPQKLI